MLITTISYYIDRKINCRYNKKTRGYWLVPKPLTYTIKLLSNPINANLGIRIILNLTAIDPPSEPGIGNEFIEVLKKIHVFQVKLLFRLNMIHNELDFMMLNFSNLRYFAWTLFTLKMITHFL